MLNYLFSLNFFKSTLLALSLLLFSLSAIAEHKNTRYKYPIESGDGFIICTKEGIEKLHRIRCSQVENKKVIYTGTPRVLELVSNEEGCYFENTEVIFHKIAEEYTLPIRERLISHENGEENCPWNALERCSLITAPAATYVEAIFLAKDGNWRGPVFIEMGGSFKLLDKPEELQAGEEDRSPDTLLKAPAE